MTGAADDIVDLQFALDGRAVPQDYADLLWQALRVAVPWLADEARAGVHPLSGLSPGDDEWYLSRRSRLSLRLPREHAEQARALSGASLQLNGHALGLGAATVRALNYSPVIHARCVAVTPPSDAAIAEDVFLAACQAELARLGILGRMICGKAQRARTADGLLSGFSLMLYDLDREDNLRIQRDGLGLERKRGCGIFTPHKSGAAVVTLE